MNIRSQSWTKVQKETTLLLEKLGARCCRCATFHWLDYLTLTLRRKKTRFCTFCGRLHGMQGYKASKVRGYKDGWTLEYGLRKRKWWWVKIHRWNVPIRMGCTHTGRLIGNLALQMNWELEACTKKNEPSCALCHIVPHATCALSRAYHCAMTTVTLHKVTMHILHSAQIIVTAS